MSDTQLDQPPTTFPYPRSVSPHRDASDVVRDVLRSWWIILLCALIAVAVGLEVNSRQAASYQATAYLLINNNNFQQAVAGGYSAANPLAQEATAADSLTPLREQDAAQAVGLRASDTYGITVTNSSANSSVLNVNATTANPRTAAALADAAAQQMIDVIKHTNSQTLAAARGAVRSQFRAAQSRYKQTLAAQLNSFQTLEALDNQSLQIIQRAQIPAVSNGSSKARTGGIALVLGLILGLAIAVLRRPRGYRI